MLVNVESIPEVDRLYSVKSVVLGRRDITRFKLIVLRDELVQKVLS